MMLEPLRGMWVVDLFAGSGALGIEALSRGARHADFVESRASARKALESNLESLGIDDRATIWKLSLPRGLRRIEACFERADLVLLDPPYGGEEARRTLAALGELKSWNPQVQIVVEHHAKDLVPEAIGGLERVRERRYGETAVSFFRTVSR